MDLSVISSSSTRALSKFVKELNFCTGCDHVDLLLFRDPDLVQLLGELPQQLANRLRIPPPPRNRISTEQLLAVQEEELRKEAALWISQWISRQLVTAAGQRVMVNAFATYFPHLSANINFLQSIGAQTQLEYHNNSVYALATSIEIGRALKSMGLMQKVVIEIVGGSLFDRVERIPGKDRGEFIIRSTTEEKIYCMLNAIRRVKQIVGGEDDWTVCVELEPDPIFTFHSLYSLNYLKAALTGFPELARSVAINLDFAHMSIASIEPDSLEPLAELIAHAHVSDHPSVHTRDRCPGTWSIIESWESTFYGYLALLKKAQQYRANNDLPHSGGLALELEGCSRFSWVIEGVSRLKYSLHMLKNWEDRIALVAGS